MTENNTHLFQVRISEEQKRLIKTLAASQGMTLQMALTEAFAAWARELKAAGGAKEAREPKRPGKRISG